MNVYKSIILAVFPITLASQLGAAIQIQTISTDVAVLLGSGSLDGESDSFVSIEFPDQSFVFDQFDPANGTLNAVTISFSLPYSFSMTASHLVTTDELDDFEASASLDLGVLYFLDGDLVFGGGGGDGGFTNTANEIVTGGDTLFQPSTSFPISDFEGTGTSEFEVVFSSTINATFDGYFTDYSAQQDAGAFFTVTYDFTPVPEPSTYAAILGFAALGGAIWVRKRYARPLK